MITEEKFGQYDKYIISSGRLSVSVCTLGAVCLSVKLDGRELCLGYDTPEEYLSASWHIGGIVGRYANRIKGAAFELGSKRFELDANENGNTLHGGSKSFDSRVWTARVIDENAVELTYISPDGENGFPGELCAKVCYRLKDDSLQLSFCGTCDKPTVFAPTSHMYFNLDGSHSILDHRLYIAADEYLSVDAQLIPEKRCPAEGRNDFRKLRKIGQGYDTAFILRSECAESKYTSSAVPALTASASGVTLSIYTDFPALQLYTGQDLAAAHHPYAGFAAEPEFFPDSPNRPDFPSAVLLPGETFKKSILYRFE